MLRASLHNAKSGSGVDAATNELISFHDDPHETLLASVENDVRSLMQL